MKMEFEDPPRRIHRPCHRHRRPGRQGPARPDRRAAAHRQDRAVAEHPGRAVRGRRHRRRQARLADLPAHHAAAVAGHLDRGDPAAARSPRTRRSTSSSTSSGRRPPGPRHHSWSCTRQPSGTSQDYGARQRQGAGHPVVAHLPSSPCSRASSWASEGGRSKWTSTAPQVGKQRRKNPGRPREHGTVRRRRRRRPALSDPLLPELPPQRSLHRPGDHGRELEAAALLSSGATSPNCSTTPRSEFGRSMFNSLVVAVLTTARHPPGVLPGRLRPGPHPVQARQWSSTRSWGP